MAQRAYRKSLEKKEKKKKKTAMGASAGGGGSADGGGGGGTSDAEEEQQKLDELTGDQRLFLSWAATWARVSQPAALKEQVPWRV